ncbi:phage late control D family protein [Pandoraea sp.]|uniref:phage late control D family protein n=1 Tax=Pandoraea sp. TaxID=1883445 RepID=UPI00120EB705|nr:phage late control D family protein [Pandoraea sp.]TAL53805.1 MAG: phage late control D family protein [Pandoraea sp.]TAM17058.1 MAG: phage late control D family protein [Pandoraea sp.]
MKLPSFASPLGEPQTRAAPAPAYRLLQAGQDITGRLTGRLIALTLTERRGLEADQLDIELDDGDGQLALPARGAKLCLALGWAGQPLVPKGTFVVDEIEHTGAPDRLIIRARSADLRGGMAAKQERSFHRNTVGEVVRAIAQRHSLMAVIHPALRELAVDHLDQTGESDANLLTRLADLVGAVATVKQDRLLFMKPGEALSASGLPLPPFILTRASGDEHRFSMAERDAYTGVRAYYQDTRRARKGEVSVPADAPPSHGNASAPSNIKELRHLYANRQNAQRAAQAEWQRIQRGLATFSITLARGDAALFPERPVVVRGWKAGIDGDRWVIKETMHSLSADGGFRTGVGLEVRCESGTKEWAQPRD